MNKLPLTKKEEDVLEFIDRYFAFKGYAPTLSEIAEFIGSSNHQAATDYVQRLEQKGFITRTPKSWRNIKLTKKAR